MNKKKTYRVLIDVHIKAKDRLEAENKLNLGLNYGFLETASVIPPKGLKVRAITEPKEIVK